MLASAKHWVGGQVPGFTVRSALAGRRHAFSRLLISVRESASITEKRTNSMKIGYARVSTDDQNLDLQRDALAAAGCERVFEDKASGAKADRPGLRDALAYARPGDCLVVWRLDRLGRSMTDLVAIVGQLQAAGVGFESLTEKIETGTATGRLVFHVFAALAEFERQLTRERTAAGLAAARARGRKGGRKALGEEKRAAIRAMSATDATPAQICKAVGVSRSTLYKYLKA